MKWRIRLAGAMSPTNWSVNVDPVVVRKTLGFIREFLKNLRWLLGELIWKQPLFSRTIKVILIVLLVLWLPYVILGKTILVCALVVYILMKLAS